MKIKYIHNKGQKNENFKIEQDIKRRKNEEEELEEEENSAQRRWVEWENGIINGR